VTGYVKGTTPDGEMTRMDEAFARTTAAIRAWPDPAGNARAAVTISRHGRDWSPWVTWNTGAYQGKC